VKTLLRSGYRGKANTFLGETMRKIERTTPVLVTGGSGYLASWIIKRLLDDGIDVNTTVRDPEDPGKTAHLQKLAFDTGAQLKIHRADLLDQGSFEEAMLGCELVIHTASPFVITGIRNPETELIRPAKEGTRNVLESAGKTPTVKRVVLTSSVVAVYGDCADIALTAGGIFTEKDWNRTSTPHHQPYSYSKTVAEKDAWSMAEAQDRWDLVVINPGWILGPSLSPRTDSTSIKTMIEYGTGVYKSGVPRLWNGIADVRDVAAAHVKAGFTPTARGRHIVVSEELTLLDIAKVIGKYFGGGFPLPRREAPKFVFWLIAPLYDRTRRYVSRNVGIPIRFDNRYSQSDLGLTYIPAEQTIRDHFQQLLDDGLLN
jgi:nucleoside-diphosphate-sugar epimerase